MQFNHIELLI